MEENEQTPVAIISNGTLNNQQIFISNLKIKKLSEQISKLAIIIIGEVLNLYHSIEKLNRETLINYKRLLLINFT